MSNVEGNPTHIRKGLLSSHWVVFLVVYATIIGVLVETGIIRVSGFVGIRDLGSEIKIFVGLGIFCIFSQLLILNFVRSRFGRPFRSDNHTRIAAIPNFSTIRRREGELLLNINKLEAREREL
jgi:hypothetical protein